MFRRALIIMAISVALSAAGAFAFAPGLSRANHEWSLGGLFSRGGFTPVPRPHDSPASSGNLLLDNQGGAPGTYCPIRPHDREAPVVAQGQSTPNLPPLGSGATPVPQAKDDLLQPAASANCAVPTPAPAMRSIIP